MPKTQMTREEWLNAFTAKARPLFKKLDAPLPKKVRMSVGMSGRPRNRASASRGICSRVASAAAAISGS